MYRFDSLKEFWRIGGHIDPIRDDPPFTQNLLALSGQKIINKRLGSIRMRGFGRYRCWMEVAVDRIQWNPIDRRTLLLIFFDVM